MADVISLGLLGINFKKDVVLLRRLFAACKSYATINLTGNIFDQDDIIRITKAINPTLKIISIFKTESFDDKSYLQTQQFPNNRFAIVIGNSNYSTTPLPSSAVSAQLIADILRNKFNFNLWEKNECQNRRDWNNALSWLDANLCKCSEAFVVLFFAGHGGTITQTHCFSCTQGDIIPLTAFYDILNRRVMKNCFSLVILDACQSNIKNITVALDNEAKAARIPRGFFSLQFINTITGILWLLCT